ncbi:MAG: bifunctional (p)ppGpp synthase/hydrolase [Sulfurospirillum sp.]|nr:MAG: bifunctional (p)ppGpp synthase/hydrolase [Sulfurospirillum sp.]
MDLLLKKIKNINNVGDATNLLYDLSQNDKDVKEALFFAKKWHEGQFRKSGEPYIIHPILVASLTAYFGGDKDMIISALLHDVVEDTECEITEIETKFSPEVAKLVEGLTKIVQIRDDKLAPSSSNERLASSALSFRKMLLASIADVRILVVKLCDRVHNMLTLDALSNEKQKRISEETMVVYVPIAHRLGISTIKNVLEDLSFSYLMPVEYKKIENMITGKDQQLQLSLNSFIDKLTNLLLKNGFMQGSFKIEKRIKHFYSIYMKMHRKGISIDEVLDLMAVRVLVEDPLDCYRVLGIVHQNFTPLISRFKDYIAIPKDNGYQTLHTTLFDERSIIETQIRTYKMHNTAQFGIAAHWKYKGYSALEPKLSWLNDLKSQSDEGESLEEMYSLAKDDLYSEDISVFSPKGDLFTLPRGATVLDFAYAIHTEVGNSAKEAYINKKRVPFLTELKNGDIVTIKTGDKIINRCSWINTLKTAKAKNAMKNNCKQKLKEINLFTSENILLNIFNLKYDQLSPYLEEEGISKNLFKSAIDKEHLQEDIYKLKKRIIANKKIFPIISPIKSYKLKKVQFDDLIFYTTSNISKVNFDYCCHPKKGDDIVAFKMGSSVVVHHKFCSHAYEMMREREPMLFVQWLQKDANLYKLIVSIENKKGSLAYFLQYLAKIDIDLVTISLSEQENTQAKFFELAVEIPPKSKEKLLQKDNNNYRIIELSAMNDAYKKD